MHNFSDFFLFLWFLQQCVRLYFTMSMRIIMTVVLCVIKRGILHVIMPVVTKKLQENKYRKIIIDSFRNGTKIVNKMFLYFNLIFTRH